MTIYFSSCISLLYFFVTYLGLILPRVATLLVIRTCLNQGTNHVTLDPAFNQVDNNENDEHRQTRSRNTRTSSTAGRRSTAIVCHPPSVVWVGRSPAPVVRGRSRTVRRPSEVVGSSHPFPTVGHSWLNPAAGHSPPPHGRRCSRFPMGSRRECGQRL